MDCDPIDADAVAGQQTNVASVTGTGPDTLAPSEPGEDPVIVEGVEVEDDDPANYFGADPQLDVVKTVQTFDANDADAIYPDNADGAVPVVDGGVVLYTYTVTNTGNVAVRQIVLVDDRVAIDSEIACDVNGNNVIGVLQPGESSTCTFAITADAAEHGDGLTNIASVTGVGPETVGVDGETVLGAPVEDDDPATFFVSDPSIDIEKFVQTNIDADEAPGPLVAPGDDVVFRYVVTNTGNVPLVDVVVTDSVEGAVTCPETELAPGESMECLLETVAVEGEYMNTGEVSGTPPSTFDQDGNEVDGVPVDDSDDAHYLGMVPGIELIKFTQSTDNDVEPGVLIEDGGTVRWTYQVTNTGNVALTNVTVSDDQFDDALIDCGQDTGNVIAELGVGDTVTCEAFGVAEPGQYMNTGSVVGDVPPTYGTDGYGPDGEPGTDDDDLVDSDPVTDDNPDHYFGVAVAIEVVKYVNGDEANEAPGPLVAVDDEVVWTYVVTNTGNYELVDIELVDDIEGEISCPETTLAVGESMTCTAEGVATAGQYTNVATVTGTGPETFDDNGDPVDPQTPTDDDPANYFGSEAAVDIVKFVNGDEANEAPGVIVTPGDTLSFDYVVTNTGNVDVVDVTVVDDMGVEVDCGDGTNVVESLSVGESVTCTGEDVAVDGQYTNVGSVTATGPETVDADGDPVPGVDLRDDDTANAFGERPGIDQPDGSASGAASQTSSGLPRTGADLVWLLVAALALLLLGGGVLFVARQRRTQESTS